MSALPAPDPMTSAAYLELAHQARVSAHHEDDPRLAAQLLATARVWSRMAGAVA